MKHPHLYAAIEELTDNIEYRLINEYGFYSVLYWLRWGGNQEFEDLLESEDK